MLLAVICSVQCKTGSNKTDSTTASVGHPLQFHKSNDGQHYAEFIRYDVDTAVPVKPNWDYLKVNPLLSKKQPSTFEQQRRAPRSNEYGSYERGYQEFLRNYHKDGDHEGYKVKEDEDDTGRSDNDEGEDDDDSGNSSDENNSGGEESDESESEEKYHKPKKSYKSKGRKHRDDESNEDYDRIKQESKKGKTL